MINTINVSYNKQDTIMAYNDNRDILSWKRLINSIQTNDKLGVVRESIKEGGVHKIQVDQQKHISAEHHEVVVSSNDMGIIVDIYDKQSNNIDTNTYWNDDVMEESKNIKEGTWSVPETPEQVEKLTNLLKNPLNAETALDELYNVFGDDELFDDLEVMKREEPETDVRHVVISRLKDMNFIKEVRENNQSKPTKESLASTTDDLHDLETIVMTYWDRLDDDMKDELRKFWDEPRDTDEIKPFDEKGPGFHRGAVARAAAKPKSGGNAYTNFASNIKKIATRNYNPIKNMQ